MTLIESAVRDGKLKEPEDPSLCIGTYVVNKLDLALFNSNISPEQLKGLGRSIEENFGIELENIPFVPIDNLRQLTAQILEQSIILEQ